MTLCSFLSKPSAIPFLAYIHVMNRGIMWNSNTNIYNFGQNLIVTADQIYMAWLSFFINVTVVFPSNLPSNQQYSLTSLWACSFPLVRGSLQYWMFTILFVSLCARKKCMVEITDLMWNMANIYKTTFFFLKMYICIIIINTYINIICKDGIIIALGLWKKQVFIG